MTVYYKFLGANYASYYDPDFFYSPPRRLPDGKWESGEWVEAKEYDRGTGEACVKGLHVMNDLVPRWNPYTGNCCEAEVEDILDSDAKKTRVRRLRLLRPVAKEEIFHEGADLEGANLRGANLTGADLTGADLEGANLTGAHDVKGRLPGELATEAHC